MKAKIYIFIAILLGICIAKLGDYLVVLLVDNNGTFNKRHMKNLGVVFVNPTRNESGERTNKKRNKENIEESYHPSNKESDAVLAFNKISQLAYDKAMEPPPPPPQQNKEDKRGRQNNATNLNINLTAWEHTAGGLDDQDRTLLAKIYGSVNSVFEYGLGESTAIAAYMNVPRYSGIDSDAVWVSQARKKSLSHFRFYFADIGDTEIWGNPLQKDLSKGVLDYQLIPLISEPYPFDAYLVDGRWRLPCMMASFLHASARGANTNDTIVMIHDCTTRQKYHKADHLLDLIDFSGHRLCVYKRKPNTTNEQLMEMWFQHRNDLN